MENRNLERERLDLIEIANRHTPNDVLESIKVAEEAIKLVQNNLEFQLEISDEGTKTKF